MSPFVSHLAAELDAFLAFKRALGSPYVRAEFTLRSFDRFVLAYAREHRPFRLDRAVSAWLDSQRNDRKPVSVTVDLGAVRQFCLHRRRRDPDAFVPGRAWAPQSTESHFLPFVFSVAQVRDLMKRTASLPGPPSRGAAFRALLLVLYCTGVRFGEALRLRVRDVDLARRLLFIAESKGRARWVPFEGTLGRELARYAKKRGVLTEAMSAAPFSSILMGAGWASSAHRTRCAGCCAPLGSSQPRAEWVPGRTTSATPSPSTASFDGTAPALTSTLGSPGCPHTWATTTFSAPRST